MRYGVRYTTATTLSGAMGAMAHNGGFIRTMPRSQDIDSVLAVPRIDGQSLENMPRIFLNMRVSHHVTLVVNRRETLDKYCGIRAFLTKTVEGDYDRLATLNTQSNMT